MAELKPKQRKFLEALITNDSIKDAYQSANISKTTAYNYLKDENFKKALTDQKREIMRGLTLRVQSATAQALDTILEIMNNEETHEATRLNSARVILQQAYRSYENDELIERQERLEERLEKLLERE